MRILLITPAPATSLAGNRATAERWAHILQMLGHQVEVTTEFSGQNVDLLIALHAWRSADAIQRFKNVCANRPLIVAITGTDAYQFIHSHPDTTLRSIELADHLVGLHGLISNTLPPDQRHKMHVIYQSAEPIRQRAPCTEYFHVAVLGHLRDEKDPLRPALAVRNLPATSRIQIHQYGKAHSSEWADAATAEMNTNPRYTWHGETSHNKIRQVYQRTSLLVLPSRMEGGANVISEAVIAAVPVIASDIEGSVGLLGARYPGYYPVEDEIVLGEQLLRAEQDPQFYQALLRHCAARQPLFTIENETRSWQDLLAIL